MTATDRIRELLDERGVEWSASDTYRLLVTSWNDASGHSWAFMEHRDGSFSKLTAYHLTPEQAITATLGSGECRFKTVERFIDARRSRADMCECDRCGYRCARGFIQDERFKYCPNCGRRIEVADG